MRRRLRMIVAHSTLLTCCIIVTALAACSSDTTGPDDPTSGDTADVLIDSTEQPDTENRPDATSDADDSTTNPHVACERSVESRISDFIPLENNTALNTTRLANPYIENVGDNPPLPCGAVALLDTSEKDEIPSISRHVYPESEVFSAKMGDQLVVVAARRDFNQGRDRWSVGPVTGLTGDVYNIGNGELERNSRKESLLDDIPRGDNNTVQPLAVVQGEPGIILVTRKFLVKLTINEFLGGLTVADTYNRREDIQTIETKLNEASEVSETLSYTPHLGRHVMLEDRYLIEIEHGVVSWDLAGWADSESDAPPSFDYLPLPESLHIPPGWQIGWEYSDQQQTLFFGRTERALHAVDVSDPASPQRTATWDAIDDFSIPMEGGFAGQPMIRADGDRLYLRYLFENQPGRYKDALTVLDISSDLTTANEIVATDDFSFLSGSPSARFYPDSERVYFTYLFQTEDYQQRSALEWVPTSEVSPDL